MVITVAEARGRGIELPDDDDRAQDIIDEQESWLEHRIGQLIGVRTETFYVGTSETRGALYLRRYTDQVTVLDAEVEVDAAHYRLVDSGATIQRTYSALSRIWTGPYVEVTYEPTDETDVRRVLFDLVAMAAEPQGPYESEQIGSYSYRRGKGTLTGVRAALASSILPARAPALTLDTSGHRRYGW